MRSVLKYLARKATPGIAYDLFSSAANAGMATSAFKAMRTAEARLAATIERAINPSSFTKTAISGATAESNRNPSRPAERETAAARMERKFSEFDAKLKELKEQIANPGRMTEDGGEIEAMRSFDPGLADSLVAKKSQAAQMAIDLAPKNPNEENEFLPHLSSWRPSEAEIDKWNRSIRAIENPIAVVEDIGKGMGTREEVDVIKQLYPSLYGKIQNVFMEKMANQKKAPPYQLKLKLARLFGSEQFIGAQRKTANIVSQSFATPPQSPPPSRPMSAKPDLSSMTTSERLSLK